LSPSERERNLAKHSNAEYDYYLMTTEMGAASPQEARHDVRLIAVLVASAGFAALFRLVSASIRSSSRSRTCGVDRSRAHPCLTSITHRRGRELGILHRT
jgi:hypothetical protein